MSVHREEGSRLGFSLLDRSEDVRTPGRNLKSVGRHQGLRKGRLCSRLNMRVHAETGSDS